MDVYSRAIVGWAAATHKRARLVLDALQMALWRRDRDGRPAGPGLVHHSDYAEVGVKPGNCGVALSGRGLLTGSSA